MNIVIMREFFGWMTLINLALFTWTTLMCMVMRGLIQQMHGKMFGLSHEAISAFLYGYLGIYKVFFITFNLIPWIALVIMT